MGSLRYDGIVTRFDDRLLTHLQIVIVQKLMRGESFLMSWKDGRNSGDGRSAIWISPESPVTFTFVSSTLPEIDTDWLLLLGKSAESTTGLIVMHADGSLAEAEASGRPYPGNLDR